jgi:16S rRNA (cytidine1402-2'-O)-methyltransferase
VTVTEVKSGRLSIVATPIGHLEDITLRALSTLRAADLVLAEDTRRTQKLLGHHGIKAKLRALHAHSGEAVIEHCLDALSLGQHLALVTDAGTPLVSDPGAVLVRLASERRFTVESIPGPSAVTAALAICGVAFDSFRFVGFAPRSGTRRVAWLDALAEDPGASVFFESPLRLGVTLAELAERLPEERTLAVCRELTKIHEEVVRGSARELAARYADGTRGEVTVVIGAGPTGVKSDVVEAPIESRIAELLAHGTSARDVARQLARETGRARREIYSLVRAAAVRLASPPEG